MCGLLWWYGVVASSLKNTEPLALWAEGIALILIFIYDRKDAKDQHRQNLQQMEIWRKQIHSDRVAEIFKVLRIFHNFLIDSVHRRKTFGPGRDFSSFGDMGSHPEGRIFPEYLAVQEAYYLSYLVSDRPAAYMKERMAEADGLQRVADSDEFYKRLEDFNKTWDVYKMAAPSGNCLSPYLPFNQKPTTAPIVTNAKCLLGRSFALANWGQTEGFLIICLTRLVLLVTIGGFRSKGNFPSVPSAMNHNPCLSNRTFRLQRGVPAIWSVPLSC